MIRTVRTMWDTYPASRLNTILTIYIYIYIYIYMYINLQAPFPCNQTFKSNFVYIYKFVRQHSFIVSSLQANFHKFVITKLCTMIAKYKVCESQGLEPQLVGLVSWQQASQPPTFVCTYYIYIYIYACVCVCVVARFNCSSIQVNIYGSLKLTSIFHHFQTTSPLLEDLRKIITSGADHASGWLPKLTISSFNFPVFYSSFFSVFLVNLSPTLLHF